MRTTKRYNLLLGLLLVLIFGTGLNAQLPSPSNPPRLVNDYTGTLNASQINTLEHKLVAYNDSTSTQILVLLVDDLQGYSIEQYATEIGHSWGVGQKDKGNGVVILVKPEKGSEKGEVNISTGYGMEQYVTDATGKNIIEKEMIPAFKEPESTTPSTSSWTSARASSRKTSTTTVKAYPGGSPCSLSSPSSSSSSSSPVAADKTTQAAALAPSGFPWVEALAEDSEEVAASAEVASEASEEAALAAAELREAGSVS